MIENNCGQCHNPDKKKADLVLTTYSGILKGSGSGQVVLPGNLDGCKLWRAINQVEEPTMPPNKPKLPDKELELFRKWIMGGRLVSCGRDRNVTIWKADGGKARSIELQGKTGAPLGLPVIPTRVTFNHDGSRIFAVDFSGRFRPGTQQMGNRSATWTPIRSR